MSNSLTPGDRVPRIHRTATLRGQRRVLSRPAILMHLHPARSTSPVLPTRRLDLLRQLREVRGFGLEDDVAALEVGLRMAEFERFVQGAEGVHLDHVVAADVHAAEHGDHNRHMNYGATARKAKTALRPPKAKELESAYST